MIKSFKNKEAEKVYGLVFHMPAKAIVDVPCADTDHDKICAPPISFMNFVRVSIADSTSVTSIF
jgi:hypothetical protein